MHHNKIRQLLISACLAVLPLPLLAGGKDAGTSSFSFLKVDAAARPVSMGGAFTGLADDASSLYYNPAGIVSWSEERDLLADRFILGYHNYFEDLQSGFIGVIHPLDENRSIGGSISYLNYGEFVRTDLEGVENGTFGGGSLVLSGSFAMKYHVNFSFGGSAKIIYEKIEEYSATGVAVDLGAKYASDRERYRAGISLLNLGAQLSGLGEEKDGLPTTLRAGVGIRPRELPCQFSIDGILPFDNDPVFAVGTEFYRTRPLYIRLGWNSFGSNYEAVGKSDTWAGFSAGVGFEFGKYELAYAVAPGADLGTSHRITLSGGF